MILAIAAVVVVIVGVIWGATAIFNSGSSEAEEGPTQTPYDEGVVVDEGPIECWDGVEAATGENCAELTGQDALDWLVTFDGASCEEVSGEYTQKECTWYDRPNSHVFVMEFASYDEAVSYADDLYGSDPSAWELNGETTGSQWEGDFTNADGGHSHMYVYEGLPYGVWVRLDNDPTHGNHDDLEDFRNRFTMRPQGEVAHAVATTERV